MQFLCLCVPNACSRYKLINDVLLFIMCMFFTFYVKIIFFSRTLFNNCELLITGRPISSQVLVCILGSVVFFCFVYMFILHMYTMSVTTS